jgi:hypothetical protein
VPGSRRRRAPKARPDRDIVLVEWLNFAGERVDRGADAEAKDIMPPEFPEPIRQIARH